MNYLRPVLISISWIPVVITFTDHAYQPYFIQGTSMTPTFNPNFQNDITLVKKYGLKKTDSFKKGDIIMFKSPTDPEKLLTKRVLGLQGDTIKCLDRYPKQTTIIPRNHLWVEGDNEFHSIDSNNFGPISQALVIGKVVGVIWPLNRIGTNLSGGRDAVMN